MEFGCWFKCLFIILACLETNGEQKIFGRCGHTNRGKGVSKDVAQRIYPWLVELRKEDNTIICAATLIHSSFVLTSAHCFSTEPDAKIKITFGTSKRKIFKNFRQNEKLITHPKYNQTEYQNDIMLIKLDKPVKFGGFIRPICLPEQNEELNTTDAEVVGFLRKTHTKKSLLGVNLKIIPNANCSEMLNSTILPTNICAGENLGLDKCLDNSGSPLMLNRNNSHSIIGLVSLSHNCASEKTPDVYTRVSSYVDWIVDVIKNESV